jgi:hypothetical protein
MKFRRWNATPMAPCGLEDGPENDYRLLVNEVMRLMVNKQLFTFVTAEPAVQPNGVSHAHRIDDYGVSAIVLFIASSTAKEAHRVRFQ